MKKAIMAMYSLVIFGVLAAAVAGFAQRLLGIPPHLSISMLIVGMLLVSYVKMRRFDRGIAGLHSGVHKSDVQVEIWSDYIIGNLFANNEFLNYCFKADDNVLNGKVVHIPQAGSPSNVEKNRSVLPANVTKRSDSDITYALDEFTTNPRVIPHADTVELSYNKMDSVMSEDISALRDVVADNIIINWAPTENIIRTTGDPVDSHLEETTGSRKKITTKDISAAQKYFNKQNVPSEGRYCLLDADMYQQLVEQLSEGQYRDFSSAMDPKTGIVGKLYGFQFFQRSKCLSYNAAGDTPYSYGAELDEDACAAGLFWQTNSLERALGEVVVFNRDNDPTYYGDLMSFLVRMGGRIRREDEKGVLALVQATSGGF